jgi:hypothetical protein
VYPKQGKRKAKKRKRKPIKQYEFPFMDKETLDDQSLGIVRRR